MSHQERPRPRIDGPILEGETILSDDYPVYWNYLYVVDGRVRRSDIQGTVADLRRDLTKLDGKPAVEIRRCDLVARGFCG